MKKQLYPWVFSAVIVVVAIFFVAFLINNDGKTPFVAVLDDSDKEGPVILGEDIFRPEDPDALKTVEGGTRRKTEEQITVPEVGEVSLSGVAVPDKVENVGVLQRRIFSMEGVDYAFSPGTIILNERDLVVINFTSVDADYDIFFPDFGVYKSIKRGDEERISFQVFDFGSYEFYCRDFCPGQQEIKGKLIVNKK